MGTIDLTHWGVEMTRKGDVPADRVLNCLTLAEFTRHLTRRKTPDPRGLARRRGATALDFVSGGLVLYYPDIYLTTRRSALAPTAEFKQTTSFSTSLEHVVQ